MPLPFFLSALFGKAAVGAIAKGIAVKAAAASAKGLVGHHAHHGVVRHVAANAAEKLAESGVDAALSKKRKTDDRL